MIGYEEAPRYAQLIRALTGDSEITPPGILLEVDRPEYAFLKRERLWTLRLGLAASPANFNKFLVQPAKGSGVISVITHVISDLDAVMGISEAVVAGGAGTKAFTRDARATATASIPRQMMTTGFTAQAAAQTGLASWFLVKAGVLCQLPFVLAPDNAIYPSWILQSLVVNVAHNVYLAGYERMARPEELGDN